MFALKHLEVWFVTGSQPLYGPKTLTQVASNSREIDSTFEASGAIPVRMSKGLFHALHHRRSVTEQPR